MNIQVGDLVAFNKLSDATWFEVIEINGYSMKIVEAGTNDAPQYMDSSLVKQHQKRLDRKDAY